MTWLRANQLLPEDIHIDIVADQSTYVRNALRNATYAAVMGALLAMIVVYLFLGNLRRTLIIGTAIPISIMVTFAIMGAGGLTLNIMTLGGLALGVGLLVDNTIVMLENMTRHQQQGEQPLEAGRNAAAEVTSAIVASTSTNLAAVLPFLFIGGLVALLFRELIFTISAAILASMVVALTLVPSLAARIGRSESGRFRNVVDRLMNRLSSGYSAFVVWILTKHRYWLLLAVAVFALVLAVPVFTSDKSEFLPRLDDGRVRIDVTADPSRSVDDMDDKVRRVEQLIWDQGHVETVFTVVGGYIFGRTERQVSNRTTLKVQLVTRSDRPLSNREWVRRFNNAFRNAEIAGIKVRSRARSIRGLRFGRSEQEISVRIQGPELSVLNQLADRIAASLGAIPGLKNIEHTAEEVRQEFAITVDRERAADLGVDVSQVGEQVRIALQGVVASDFLEGDRSYPILVRLPRTQFDHPKDLDSVLLFPATEERPVIYLGDVAEVMLVPAPLELHRDNQNRIIEVTAAPKANYTLGQVIAAVRNEMSKSDLPPGYTMYFGGAEESLQKGQGIANIVLSLALFLVFVVLAVQYESLRNPLVILLCVPFTIIGVAIGLAVTDLPLSMPIWLGLIMLAGIVVNNSIVLVEYIEILRERGEQLHDAIAHAARLRLRPILMTTLTTVVGMSPLALGLGEGAEMLQPLAVTIVAGLSFAMIVSLGMVPAVYLLFHQLRRADVRSVSPASG
jgi:multidrug efflux pump subunit AcrB